jgi:tRNA 2-thiouridine synthesizing protein D
MKYGIVVTSAKQGAQSAALFVRAALEANHDIHRVFFYGEGVLNAKTSPSNSQPATLELWQQLQLEYDLDLTVCVSAAKNRHMLAPTGSDPLDDQVATGFTVSGLGQLADAAAYCDRLITFR